MFNGMYCYPKMENIIFGRRFTESLQEEIERHNACAVFLIASNSLLKETDTLKQIRSVIGDNLAGLYTKIRAQTPRCDLVDAACAARKVNADLIVTLGGGSMTDAGKMVTLCLGNNITESKQLDALLPKVDGQGGLILPEMNPPGVRSICISTTLAGAEYSNIAGITDTKRNIKETFKHPLMMPNTVILDPWLTTKTPEWLFLSTAIRAIDHASETICSIKPNPMAEATSLHALRLFGQNLCVVKTDPVNIDARLNCQIATWLSMVGIQSDVPQGASHAIGHELGGTVGVPHGYTSCIMLPHVLRFNYKVNAKTQGLISEALGEANKPAADVVATLISKLGMPTRLRDVNVKREDLSQIANNSMSDPWTYSNPRKISSAKTIYELLEAAW